MIISPLFEKFRNERNLKTSTTKGYLTPIENYSKFHNLDIEDLIDEAIIEEQDKIPLKNRLLKQRLIDYRSYLANSNRSASTQKTYLNKIKSFYAHFGIEIPPLPAMKYEKEYVTTYHDLPTHKHIRQAVEYSNLGMKAVILFMASSGTAKAETLSLTVENFLTATNEYHTASNIKSALTQLSKKKFIVPTFHLKRLKTDKYYYTFCTPEATHAIINYLKTRTNLSNEDKIFNYTDSTLTNYFREINDYMNWGFKGNYRFFRSHTLRKFHASNLNLHSDYIDALQGRGRSKVHEAYIKTNPVKLKSAYINAMRSVTIFNNEPDTPKNRDYNITLNVFVSGKEYTIME